MAGLRAVIAQRGPDGPAGELVARPAGASPEFRAMWARHAVATVHCPTKVVDDERVGRIGLGCAVVISSTMRQRMLMLKPVPGTPSAVRIAALHAYRPPPRSAPHEQDVVGGARRP